MNPNDMNGLTRAVYEKLKPVLPGTHGAKGKILSYDQVAKLASVQVPDPDTKQLMIYHRVQVTDHNRGLHLVAPKPGTEVWVTFDGNVTPTITTIFTDKPYKEDLRIYYGPQISRYMSYI